MKTLWPLALALLLTAAEARSQEEPAAIEDTLPVPEQVGRLRTVTAPTPPAGAKAIPSKPQPRVRPGGDHLGLALAVAGDLNGDGREDVVVGAYGDDSAAPDAGAVLVLSGGAGDTLLVLQGERTRDRFGAAVSRLGDLNGDGIPDFLVGAPGSDPEEGERGERGRVYVFSGRDGALLSSVTGTAVKGRLGYVLAGLGDLDGDGVPDFAASQRSLGDTGLPDQGAVLVFSGATGSRLHTLLGDQPSERFGAAVAAAGDVDLDGRPDILVGAYRHSGSHLSAGAAYLFSGRSGERLRVFHGEAHFGHFGYAVGTAGDWNGDGLPDFAIGARFSDRGGGRAGRVFIYSGRDGSRLQVIPGPSAGAQLGTALVQMGDVDGDGTPDLLVGAPRTRQERAEVGAVHVVSARDGRILRSLRGEGSGDNFGASLAAGDLNGDGVADLVVGASGSDAGGVDAGKMYAFSGGNGMLLWAISGRSDIQVADTAQALAAWPDYTPGPVEASDTLQLPELIYDSTQVDAAPVLRRSTAAAYPASARGSGLAGWVYLRILVLPDGSPGKVEIYDDSGLGPEFRSASVDAAGEWTFLPATLNGQAVPCWTLLPIGFEEPLAQNEEAPETPLPAPSAGEETAQGSAKADLSPPGPERTTPASESAAAPPADTAAATAQPADSGDRAPLLVARVEPQYPAAARLAGDTATVRLRILVDTAGAVARVELIEVTTPGRGFEEAARSAVRRWRFEPGRRAGVAVEAWLEYALPFHL